MVMNLPANAREVRDAGLIPGSGRSPGGWHGNPLQYSCLENPMDRGARWATVHRVAHSCMNDPTIPLLGINPEKTIIERDACIPVFIVAELFIIARKWTQPRCPPTDEWRRQ